MADPARRAIKVLSRVRELHAGLEMHGVAMNTQRQSLDAFMP
jgi:hypothetical protein